MKIKSELEKNNTNKFAIWYIFGEKENSKSKKEIWIYDSEAYELYTGEKIERKPFDKDIKEKYFSEKQEGMLAIDGILYVVIDVNKYN